MPAERLSLPIDPFLPAVVAALRGGRDLVLVAEPGAGKTTRVPPAIVRELDWRCVALQPRRVAVRAAARRIADEQAWTLGGEVGYQVRFERVASRDTRLLICTEGVLVRRLVADPELAGVDCVLLDEFHERSVQADLALAMLRELKQALRPELRLVVMSATLDAAAVADFLAESGPVERFEVPGRLFPVEVRYAGDSPAPAEERVAAAALDLIDGGVEGDVLAFLPGVREIERCLGRLDRACERRGYEVIALHGSLTKSEQDRAVFKRPGDPPRIICATNIAETSLTLPEVRAVIDSGLVRRAGYDAIREVQTLTTERISRASAEQRRGRAGRVAEGLCVRLWSAMAQHRLPEFDEPEIRRVDPSEAALSVLAWGGTVESFGWYERPPAALLESAMRLLEALGALKEGRLTPLGRVLQAMPLHPRPGRLLTAAPAHLRQAAATAAALISEAAEIPGARTMTIAQLVEALERGRLDPATQSAVARARQALLRHDERRTAPVQSAAGTEPESLEEVLLLAYPDRVCRRREGDAALARRVGGGGVRLAEAAVIRGELFLALDLRRGTAARAQQADAALVAPIEESWLSRHFPQRMQVVDSATLDEGSGRVVKVRQRRYGDLVLREDATGSPAPDEAARVLREALIGRAPEMIGRSSEASELLARIGFARSHLPEEDWPALEPGAIVAAACMGSRIVAEVESRLVDAIGEMLPWRLRRLIEEEAPAAVEVPTGSRIRLDWTSGERPVLGVRLQELFGLEETPRVARGRVAVILHLLGPNFRPVQVTDDLASFWRNTYPQVRKDLRARYPKHAWPEDPARATPVRGAPRRRG